ncbi:MAG: DsrE family protein [Acidiferrobacter sp.]
MTWKVAVRNAHNLQRALRPHAVQIEIIVFGPGLKMLLKNSPVAPNLIALHRSGVTIEARKGSISQQGLAPDQILPIVHYIPSGIAEIVRREREGWAYIRP